MKVTKQIKITYVRKLNAADICRAFGLAPGTRVSFRVPGGGDWSHVSIEVDDENPIECEWENEKVEVEHDGT